MRKVPNKVALNDTNLSADSRPRQSGRRVSASDSFLTAATLQLTRAGHAFHHKAGAAARDVRNDGRAAMDFGDNA